MIILYSIFAFLFLIILALIIPRVHVRGEVSFKNLIFSLDYLWASVQANAREEEFTGRVLWFKFPRPPKPEKKKKGDHQSDFERRQDFEAQEDHTHAEHLSTPIIEDGETSEDTHVDQPFEILEQSSEEESVSAEPEKSEEWQNIQQQDNLQEKEPIDIKVQEPTDKEKGDFTRKSKDEESKTKEEPEPDFRFWIKFVWEHRVLFKKIIARFVSGIIHFFSAIKRDYFTLRITYDLDNPAITGISYGMLTPLYALNQTRGTLIDITPQFNEELELDFYFACSFSMRPIQVVWVFLREAIRFPYYSTIRTGWKIYKIVK